MVILKKTRLIRFKLINSLSFHTQTDLYKNSSISFIFCHVK